MPALVAALSEAIDEIVSGPSLLPVLRLLRVRALALDLAHPADQQVPLALRLRQATQVVQAARAVRATVQALPPVALRSLPPLQCHWEDSNPLLRPRPVLAVSRWRLALLERVRRH
jgi:hypothetical protein